MLRGGGLRGEAMASTLIAAYPTLQPLVSRYRPPMIVHLYVSGEVKMTENGGRRGPER